MIIGSKVIALSYVIRENYDPDLEERATWDLKVMLGTPHKVPRFAKYNLTIHNIIISTIADGFNVFTHMKPHIKKESGRLDVKSLRKIYNNAAMQEQYINKAKRKLESMIYINENAMKFEKFFAKFVKAVEYLEISDRGMHNADVVDIIWKKMTNPDLSQYVIALKIKFQREPRD